MSLFPASPTNGQTTTVNGILYTYNSAQTGWVRTGAGSSGDLAISGNISATGNVSGTYILGNGSQLTGISASATNISNGTSNLNIPIASGNLTISIAGNSNVAVFTDTGVNIAGTLNTGSGVITGNGSGLTQLAGANVTGWVPNANVANYSVTTATSTGTYYLHLANATSGNVALSANTNINVAVATGALNATLLGGTLTTAAQPNVTSVGTLTSLGVNGTVTAVNITANTGVITGNGNGLSSLVGANVTGWVANANVANNAVLAATSTGTYYLSLASATSGNIALAGNTNINVSIATGTVNATTFAGNLNGVGNSNVGNIGGNNAVFTTVTGTLSTAAQPNITSVGTLSSLTVTANVAAGNLTTNGILSVTGTSQSSIAGNLNMNSKWVVSLSDPVNAQDAATKNYVDAAVTGLHVHDSCYVATTGTLATASGGSTSYNNGTSGVGATITTTGTYNLIDGGNVQTVGTRILVKNEANAVWNGIYTYTSTTILTRATDFDTTAEAAGGDFVFVTSGSTQADTGWVQTTDNPTIGTNDIVFTQFSGAGTYTAGTGLTLTGTVFSISNTTVTSGSYGNGDSVASFTVNTQGQLTAASNVAIAANAANLTGTTLNASVVTSSLTSVGTVTTGIWNNNIGSSATFAAGLSGANLASITGANVSGTVASATAATNASALLQNTSTSTTVYPTFTTLSANGNSQVVFNTSISANLGNAGIIATTFVGNLSSTGNSNIGNLGFGAGQVTGTGNITGGNIIGIIAAGSNTITTTGNITGGNLLGIHANGNSNVNIPSANGNVNISAVGNANILVITGTGVNVAGTLNATGAVTGRIDPRANVQTSASTLTVDISTYDTYIFTALAATLAINASTTGTPINGDRMTIRIKDNGNSQTLNWTTTGAGSWRVIGTTLPTATTAGKLTYVGAIYNSTESYWDVVAVTTQA